MTQIEELFDLDELATEVAGGFVSERFHPQHTELVILNYTPEAQFSRHWNDVTRKTRGLIYNSETGEVLARPFQKMHNWDEAEAPKILSWDAPLFAWSNKYDGSLGIMYRLPNGRPAIATRGSFDSEQARKATQLLHDSGMAWVYDEYITSGFTPLFEIIYPENRIVIDYGTAEMLVLLGYMNIEHGYFVPAGQSEVRTFGDIVMDLSRKNAEGWVVWIDAYKGVKIKQADYVELHRIVTGLNRKSIWRAIKDGTFETLIAQLPDELYKWADGVYDELHEENFNIMSRINAEYVNLTRHLEDNGFYENPDQKTFALAVQKFVPAEYRGYMFSIRAGKDIREKVWATIEPKGGDR